MSFDNWLRSEDNCHEMLFVARKVAATVVLDGKGLLAIDELSSPVYVPDVSYPCTGVCVFTP